MGKSSGDSPDITGAADIEGKYGVEQARNEAYANRPDQYNAFGNLTWEQQRVQDPATGAWTTKWTQRENLSPEMQETFDNQMYANQQRSAMSAGMMGRVEQEMGAPPDWEQFGEGQLGPQSMGMQGAYVDPTTGDNPFEWDSQNRQRAEDAAYGRSTSRLDPQFAQREQAMEIKLRNQGLRPGEEAYDNAMGNFNRDRADAYEQARMGSVGTGRMEDQQSYGQAQGTYGTNLQAQQQQFGQQIGSAENLRSADQQDFSQQTQSTNQANALRDKQIQEYLAKRQFSLNESQALDPTKNVGEMTQTFGSGG